MAKSIDTILKELNLSEDSTLEELFSKLQDYSVVKEAEILGIKNISVTTLPTVVKNQEEAVKRKMVGIATDEEKGITAILNKRIAIISKLLRLLSDESSNLLSKIGVSEDEINVLKTFSHSHANKVALDTITAIDLRNYDLAFNVANSIKNKIINGKVYADFLGGYPVNYYASSSEVKGALSNANRYTDTKASELKQYVQKEVSKFTDISPESLQTLKELEEAFKEHEDEYDAILQQISSKATKVELNEKVEQIKEELTEKIDENTSASKIMFDDGVSLEEKYANGELGSGGGGGGSGVDDEIILITISPSTVACGKGEDVLINYNFTREVQKTRTGSEKIYVDGVLYSTRYISQGDNVATISNLSSGSHNVEIQVTSSGLSASLVYVAEVIELTISSTFDGFGIYTNPITYRYTPVGNIQKTIHLIIDGKEYTQVVNESNKAMTYTLKTLEHGSHKFSVYATAKVGGSDITSNVLTYDLVVNNGGTDTIIACPFETTQITQGDLLQFNYVVFTPNSLQSNVSLKINGEEISNLNVDRTQQTWSLRNYPTGNIVCSIESGNKKVSFNIEVKAVDLKVEAISHNLELFLTSTGRSNNENESVRDVWENNGVSVSFSNFNWKSNGWVQDDEGNSVLRISGDSRIIIPFNIFAEDFRSIGKTIEFEFSTHDIRDYDSVLIDCLSNGRGFSLTSNNAKLFSELTRIETKFKEDEKVRVSFVIEPTSENRLIYTYINGVLSGLIQYPNNDNFSQSNPVGITIGSNDATIDLYNIRVYNINLDHSDILTNFIADTPDRLTKFALYNNNDIFDSYGSIDYNKVVNRIPCLTFIGELPATKGDKKTVSIRYVNNFDSSKNFVSSDVTLDIQGTSSQYYPRKNYKFELPTSYKLTSNSIAETVFCLKADYMESSHSHNTGLAKIVNTLYPSTPASRIDDKVQAAITGFPIVVWYKETERSPLKCLGVYNFNNDKDDTTTFGYTSAFPNCESWEFTNNTSAHCLFQNDNFEDTVEVAKNFEARYPDKYTDYTNLSRVVSWVVSTNGDLEKFKNEFNSYFNLESTLLYYCLTELFAMVDSRAKNLFLTTWDGNIWYPTFYDMDTAFGLNNEGVNDFAYQVEYHDIQGSQNVFNGESSVLWNNFEQAYADEIQEFYNNLRNNKLVTYDTVMDILYEQQISKICENNYNYDAVEKYKNPLVNEGDGTYIYCAQGNRLDHLKWWLYNRINYMDSKYVASDYKDNYITLRIYTPDSYGSVIPNADAHITPYADQYVTVKYDENMFNERGTHDEETIIEAPNQIFNDTPMIIYGASRISDIGDLSSLYAGTVDVSKGIKLKQLIVGNSANDYSNTNLKTLTIGNNELLTKLDVRNCPSLTQAIDASGCSNIEEIYATGTSSTSVKVANGGNLKVLHLPNTITNLTIQNQPFITDFVCGDYSKISTLRVENTPLDTLSIVNGAINSLERVRLVGVDWTLSNTSLLEKFKTLKGLDEKDNNTDKAVLTGKVHINDKITSIYMDECVDFFGTNLTITANDIEWYYKCKFESYDGLLLEEFYVKEGNYATYSGETPTKPNDEVLQEKYTFSNWTPSVNQPITQNTVFAPEFAITKYYEVTFKNYDDTILQSYFIDEGQPVTYTGETPTKPLNFELQESYTFSEWTPSIKEEITSNTTYTPIFSISKFYEVVFKNWDGSILQTSYVDEGKYATFNGSTPTRPNDETYYYEFDGWDLSLENEIQDNTTFTAQYTPKELAVVTWLNWDGTELQRNLVSPYDTVSFTSVATKPDDNYYTDYVLSGWLDSDGEFYEVGSTFTTTENMTLTAQFEGEPRTFTVYWYNGDELITTTEGKYGLQAEYTGEIPAHPDGYTFIGWSKTPNSSNIDTDFTVTEDMELYAVYEKPDMILVDVSSNYKAGIYLTSVTGKEESIQIDWGDGEITTYNVGTSITRCPKQNGYTTAGEYLIKLPATDTYTISLKDSNLRIISINTKYFKLEFVDSFAVRKLSSLNLGTVSEKIGLTIFPSLAPYEYGTSNPPITQIIVPDGITELSSNAFARLCNLTSVVLPEGLIKMGYGCFTNVDKIESFYIPSTLQTIGLDTTSTYMPLPQKCREFIIGEGNKYFRKIGRFIEYGDNPYSAKLIAVEYDETIDTFELPEGWKGYAPYAFAGTYMKTLKLDHSGKSSYYLSSSAFAKCTPEEIIITNPKTGFGMRNSTTKTIEVTFTESSASMYNLCSGFEALENLIVHGTCTDSRLDSTYSYCGLPDDKIYIPETTTSMSHTFYYNTSITQVTIPPLVTRLNSTFYQCSNLKKIIMQPTTPPTIYANEFDTCKSLEEIKVPTFEAYMAYTTATNWSAYADIITTDENGVLPIKYQGLALDSKPNATIKLNYLGEPNFTVTTDNPNICVASVTEDVVTITAVGAGTTNVTVTLEGANSQTFSVTVVETTPEFTYEVQAVEGATYGFTLTDDNYYRSTNDGKSYSYSLCKLKFTSNGVQNLFIDCINHVESAYSGSLFGSLSKVDTTMKLSYENNAVDVYKDLRGCYGNTIHTIDYGTIPAGEHFIYIKFSLISAPSNHFFKFKVRIE